MQLIEVAFKGNRREFFHWPAEEPPPLKAAVIVEADRGEDLGVVHAVGNNVALLVYVLSYRVGSLAAVATLIGVAFLVGGITQLAVASRVQSWRWLYIISGILGVAAGIGTFFWPDITLYVVSILVAWYLIAFGIIHLVDALAGPKVGWWWTGLLLGVAELALGVWAVRSWERSLLTLMTLVGVWAIVYGVNEIFAAFTLREAGKRLERVAS